MTTKDTRKWWVLAAMTFATSMIFIDVTVVPVDKYGTRDPHRRVIYQSVVGVGGGPNGVQHLEFTIDDAITLSDAVELWSTAASKAIESAIELAGKRRFEQSMLMGGSAAAKIN